MHGNMISGHSTVISRIICVAVWILSLVSSTYTYTCDIQATDLIKKHSSLEGSQFWEAKTNDIGACARSCVRRRICGSFNFDLYSRVCELSSETVESMPAWEMESATKVYSDIAWWPGTLDPSCHGRPCAEDEVCFPATPTTGIKCAYSCLKLLLKCPVPTVGVATSTTVGSVAQFTCNHGYVGGGSATCLPTQKWSKELITLCVPVLGNECTSSTDCDVIHGICDNGRCACPPEYIYVQEQHTCQPGCDVGALTTPANGNLVIGDVAAQTTAVFSCDAGYIPDTDVVATCQSDGTWSVTTHTCFIACDVGALTKPDNGNLVISEGFYQTTAVFSCDAGYIPDTDVVSTCQSDGTWSVTTHTCFVLGDCLSRYNAGYRQDGVFDIILVGGVTVTTWCDMTNGGWTVFQRRQDGSEDFYRGWDDYAAGFGNQTGEFWLGLEAIHLLTTQPSDLYIYMEAFSDQTQTVGYATYTTFLVGDVGSKYQLTVGGYTGDCGDAMTPHNGAMFSTKDRDNDSSAWACATTYHGAWWYSACHSSNLNGYYYKGPHEVHGVGVNWSECWGYLYSLKTTVMKVRRKSFQ